MSNTVLVVEDDEDMGAFIADFLVDHGYRAVRAANGREALKRIQSERPALILTDLVMPVMDGVELLQRLRKDATNRDIPVVVLTGANDTMIGVRLNAPVLYKGDFEPMLGILSRYFPRAEAAPEERRPPHPAATVVPATPIAVAQ